MTIAIEKDRIFNFSAGPAVLPESVIEQAQRDMWNIFDSGIGIMEHSHRGPVFDRVISEAKEDCRAVADIGDDYEILFLQGGATTQFGMIPMSFLSSDRTADYPNTGVWASKAMQEARRFGTVNEAYDGKVHDFRHIPRADELKMTANAVYMHYCSNNTIYGTRFDSPPMSTAPLVCDASSEIFSRPLNVPAHALIYAGAQKNLGPAGVTLVIIRKDFAETANQNVMAMMNYKKMIQEDSRLNTPPTFGIYFMGLVFKWILQQGGLAVLEKRNEQKAQLIYDVIDEFPDFYRGHSEPACRSRMNITFRTPSEELDKKFLGQAASQRMDGLKGHRNVGGIRASIYNAFPVEGCELLAQFMRGFVKRMA
jgi:phosphoserine aminotransferase